MQVRKTQIEDEKAKAMEQVEKGSSQVPSMSYEEGVLAALDWVDGTVKDKPMDM